MDEPVRFVARLLEGEKMAPPCRDFGISRKTGHKIFNRCKEMGIEGLTGRSRRPCRQANRLPFQTEALIVSLKKEQPSRGAPKIRGRLKRLYPHLHAPAVSTVHAVLDRHDPVTRRRPRRPRAQGTALSRPRQPNDLWRADCKGEFIPADKRHCHPLTVTDHESRCLFACEASSSTKEAFAFPVFERLFKEFGLPQAIRADNGVPFAGPNALYKLSRLAVWWLQLGIAIARIKPGCPQQNGHHGRMHLTLKQETAKPAGENFLQQQGRFDDFLTRFNTERPHRGLGTATPAERCQPGPRPWRDLPEIDYPFHDKTVTVTSCGRICVKRKKVSLSTVFAGQKVGIHQVDDRLWPASFMTYDLGYFDEETCRLEPIDDPFGKNRK